MELDLVYKNNVFYGVAYENWCGALELWDTISPDKDSLVAEMKKNKKDYNSPLYIVKLQMTEIVKVVR